ncbi:MAG TPA: BON domain-containing protein [Flavisolibacter sp.]|nr:BON domain-containing protein [Flavisolibacter sp.]
MNAILLNSRLTAVLLLVTGICFTACGSRSDEEIKKDISSRLAGNAAGGLHYANVQADVKEGVVTLTGQCEGENCVDSLSTRLNEVDGVKEVKNNVTMADMQTDYTLRTSVQAIISKYQGVQADVAGGVVVLRGTIARDQVQPLMNELSTLKAKKLDNQLAIQ